MSRLNKIISNFSKDSNIGYLDAVKSYIIRQRILTAVITSVVWIAIILIFKLFVK